MKCKRCGCPLQPQTRFEIVAYATGKGLINIFRDSRTYSTKAAAQRMAKKQDQFFNDPLTIRKVLR